MYGTQTTTKYTPLCGAMLPLNLTYFTRYSWNRIVVYCSL